MSEERIHVSGDEPQMGGKLDTHGAERGLGGDGLEPMLSLRGLEVTGAPKGMWRWSVVDEDLRFINDEIEAIYLTTGLCVGGRIHGPRYMTDVPGVVRVEESGFESQFFDGRLSPVVDAYSWYRGFLFEDFRGESMVLYTPWIRQAAKEVRPSLVVKTVGFAGEMAQRIIDEYIVSCREIIDERLERNEGHRQRYEEYLLVERERPLGAYAQ